MEVGVHLGCKFVSDSIQLLYPLGPAEDKYNFDSTSIIDAAACVVVDDTIVEGGTSGRAIRERGRQKLFC